MSHDGEITIELFLAADADDIADALVERRRSVRLRYVFGYGETRVITRGQLDAVVALPWLDADDLDLDLEEPALSFLPAGDVAAAVDALGALLRRPPALARAIGADVDSLREAIAAHATEADALTGAQRLAQIVARLHRVARRALDEDAGVAMLWRELS